MTFQHRSLKQAGDALNIRQLTLSRRLRDVEIDIGANLFERTNAGTRPTIARREFLSTTRQIVAEIDKAVRRLQAQTRGENGQLTIGVYAFDREHVRYSCGPSSYFFQTLRFILLTADEISFSVL